MQEGIVVIMLGCLFIASKLYDTQKVSIESLLKTSCHQCTLRSIVEAESKIVEQIHWNILSKDCSVEDAIEVFILMMLPLLPGDKVPIIFDMSLKIWLNLYQDPQLMETFQKIDLLVAGGKKPIISY
jgi:hypothetical protein